MIYFCAQCHRPLALPPFQMIQCACGAVYYNAVNTTTSNSTAPTWQGIPLIPYSREFAREAVPQAFYDAFKDSEVSP